MTDVLNRQDFEVRLKQLAEHRERVKRVVAVFEPGVHYDRRNACGKPALYRAGADEALNVFGIVALLNGQAVSGDGVATPHVAILMKAEAKEGDKIVAVAYGGANSFEEPFSSLPQPWKQYDKIVDLASDRAVINLALNFGLSSVFALGTDGIDACVQTRDPGPRKSGFALPDAGGCIPQAAAPTATGSPLTPYIKDDPKVVEKKVDAVASLNLTGNAREDLATVTKVLAAQLGRKQGEVMLELSSFTSDSGELVPGFSEITPRRSDRWISSTLTKAKKKLQEVGIVAVVDQVTF